MITGCTEFRVQLKVLKIPFLPSLPPSIERMLGHFVLGHCMCVSHDLAKWD